MPNRPRSDLVKRALGVLQVAQAGQPIADEDQRLVDSLVEPLFADLSERQVTTITDANVIPEAQFLHLAILLADAAKFDFGLTALPLDDPASRLTAAMTAEMRLRAITYTEADLYDVTVVDPDTAESSTEEHTAPLVVEYI